MAGTIMRLLAITEGKLRPDRSADGIGAMLDAVESWNPRYFDRFRVRRVQINEDDGWFDLLGAIVSGDYDQIWFFGSGSTNHAISEAPARALSKDELCVLRNYMDAGGGVFATGDHDDVGAPLCASIPRVRYMRTWGASGTPSKDGRLRAETLFMSGMTGRPDNEQDAIGKPVWVKGKNSTEPHELLRGRDDKTVIRWLPDHMHEGVCLTLPNVFDDDMRADFTEGGALPEIVAWSVRRGFLGASGTVEGMPSIHGVVGCYEGDCDGVGRVVVDSTFHHWVQDNTQAMLATAAGAELEYYPRNIAVWLSKAMRTPVCRIRALLRLGDEERIKAIRSRYPPPGGVYYRELGRSAIEHWARAGLNASLLRAILAEHAADAGFVGPIDGGAADPDIEKRGGAATLTVDRNPDAWEHTGRLFEDFLNRVNAPPEPE